MEEVQTNQFEDENQNTIDDDFGNKLKSQLSEYEKQIAEKSSNSSSEETSDEQAKWKLKTKRKNLKQELKETQERYDNELKVSKGFKEKLQEECDAKERVEGYLKELQEKHQKNVTNLEILQTKLNNKEEYCRRLEKKLKELNEELPEEDDNMMEEGEKASIENIPKEEQQLVEAKDTNQSNALLMETFLKQIHTLDQENRALKEQKLLHQDNGGDNVELTEDENAKLLVEQQVKSRLQDMESCLVDQSQLQAQNKVLECQINTLQESLDDYQKKYAETIVTLKEVQEAYGNKRDEILENFKDEVEELKAKLGKAEGEVNPNEKVITGLRQEILDARLSLERCKQTHKEELINQNKQYQTLQENLKNATESMADTTIESEKLRKMLTDKQDILLATDHLSNERIQIINTLKSEMVLMKDSLMVSNRNLEIKEEEITGIRSQMIKQAEMLNKENSEKENLLKNVDIMEQLKEDNQTHLEEMDELKSKLKMKKMNLKFIKKQLVEMEDQKEKLDSIAFVLPEMQKKVDQLEEEKLELQEKLSTQIQKEEERINLVEQEKMEKEERIQREKENWERRLLGIGQCGLHHEHENCNIELSNSFNRPKSAPSMKPRPPSARRYHTSSSHHGRNHTSPSGMSLSQHFLHSGAEGRRTSDKVRSRHQRIIMNGGGKNKERLFRSSTMDYTNSYSHSDENKFFPTLRKKGSSYDNRIGNISPRVLVWGSNDEDENAGKKLVAVGDRILAKIFSDCNQHGKAKNENTGLVKFIGFIDGNSKDVYIGLRMDEEVGNTDGSTEGKRYFRCERNRGKFIHLDDIIKVIESQTIHQTMLTS